MHLQKLARCAGRRIGLRDDGLNSQTAAIPGLLHAPPYTRRAFRRCSYSANMKRMRNSLIWKKVVPVYAHTMELKISPSDLDVSDPSLRDNAVLLHGSPISSLPTANIFAYATHFDAHPIGLEWIDDTTCILVFSSKGAARAAFRVLTKSYTEDPSEEGFITSKPIPIALWPPEDRINKSLGMGEGLKGIIRMRWALTSDVKKKGANKESQFYRRYGKGAGKGDEENWPAKRRRMEEDETGESDERARLDNELDAFLAEGGEDVPPPSPPSKMRADYIDTRRTKTLLERTTTSLESRLTAPLPRRGRRGEAAESLGSRLSDASSHGTGRNTESGHGRRHERPKKTQEDLDAELDAFLNSKN